MEIYMEINIQIYMRERRERSDSLLWLTYHYAFINSKVIYFSSLLG